MLPQHSVFGFQKPDMRVASAPIHRVRTQPDSPSNDPNLRSRADLRSERPDPRSGRRAGRRQDHRGASDGPVVHRARPAPRPGSRGARSSAGGPTSRWWRLSVYAAADVGLMIVPRRMRPRLNSSEIIAWPTATRPPTRPPPRSNTRSDEGPDPAGRPALRRVGHFRTGAGGLVFKRRPRLVRRKDPNTNRPGSSLWCVARGRTGRRARTSDVSLCHHGSRQTERP
jgi:hypothetical protein